MVKKKRLTQRTCPSKKNNGRMCGVRSYLEGVGVGAMLVTCPENIRYMTGFTGSESLLLLEKTKSTLIVDSRYTDQALSECVEVKIVESNDKIREVSKIAKKLVVKRIGFEPQQLTVFQYRKLKHSIDAGWKSMPEGIEKFRQKKDSGELETLRKSARISSRAFLGILGEIKAGIEEVEVSLLLEFQIKKDGAEATPFPLIVASGKRGALPHGLASKKKIKNGEFITVDFGAVYKGYCSDETCTAIVGKPTKRQERVYRVVKDAHDRAIGRIRPGIKAKDIDSAAREVIEKAGLGKYFKHGTGHGVGLTIHEEPRIAPRQEVVLEEGMVFTVEPGVYIPGWGGVRIEDMVAVTGDGCEVMSEVPKGLMLL